jgi:tetratricopeptide (TPR) repeat protein
VFIVNEDVYCKGLVIVTFQTTHSAIITKSTQQEENYMDTQAAVSIEEYNLLKKELERLQLLLTESSRGGTQRDSTDTTLTTTSTGIISPTTTTRTFGDNYNGELTLEKITMLQEQLNTAPHLRITEEQKRIKLENVINSFNRRGWNYLGAPTHPDDNDFNPIHIAFIIANSGLAKFVICKCVEHGKWELLLPSTNQHRNTTMEQHPSPFDLALECSHVDFVREMLVWLRAQMKLVATRERTQKSNKKLTSDNLSTNSSNSSSSGRMTINLTTVSDGTTKPITRKNSTGDSSSPGSTRSPNTRRHMTFISRSTSMMSISRGGTDRSGISSTTDLSSGGSDLSTSTEIFEEFDQMMENTAVTDVSESIDEDDDEREGKESLGTSTNRDNVKFDETQYNLHQYDELLNSAKIKSDPLFQESFTPRSRLSSNSSSSPVTSVKESSFFTSCTVTKKANMFKPGVYFTESSDHDENYEEKLLYSGLVENSELTVPNHVRQCITTMCDDFVVFEPEPEIQMSKVNRKKLQDMLYEIDLKELGPKKRKALLNQKPKRNLFAKEPVEEIVIDPLKAEPEIVTKFMAQEYEIEDRKNFILESLEDIQPVHEVSRNLGLHYSRPDILLHDFQFRDEIITSATDVLFTPKGLSLKIFERCGQEQLEEILCSVALFEAVNGGTDFIPLTEVFTFSFTQDHQHNENPFDISQHKALFNIEGVSENTIALFRLIRKFKGEHTEPLNELYLKGDKAKDKEVSTLKAKLTKFEAFENTYSYFAWAAVSVRGISNGELVHLPLYMLPSKPGNIPDKGLLQLYTHPETRKHKAIPGVVALTLKEISISPVPRHFIPATNQMVIKLDNHHVPVSKMKSLEYIDTKVLDIENTFVVRPMSLSNIKKDAKNIEVVVSLCENDADVEQSGLSVVYPLKTNSTNELGVDGHSFVSLSNQSPDFSREVKMKIPSNLTPDHHLLFKFYSVNHKESLLPKTGQRTLVAYAYLKVFNDNKLPNGIFDIPVYSTKATGRTTAYMKNLDGKMEGSTLKVRLLARSITYPVGSHGNLERFFNFVDRIQHYFNVNKEMVELAVSGLTDMPLHLSAYAPMVFTQLFRIIEENPGLEGLEVRIIAFRVIMRLVDKYRKENPAIVLGFVKYHFNHTSICEALLKPMQIFMETENGADQDIVLRNSWFIFSVLLKSIVLHLDLKKNKENCKDFEFSQSFRDMLSDFVLRSTVKFMKRKIDKEPSLLTYLSAGIAAFLSKLLSLMRKGYVLLIATRFNDALATISKQETAHVTSIDMQLVFFRELFAYEQYVLLFLPQTPSEALQIIQDTTMLEDDLSINTYNHFIYSAFVDVIIRCLYNQSRSVRMKGITVLREFVYKTNWDERYQAVDDKERINQIHFEFVNKFIDIMEEWKRISCDKKKKISSDLAGMRKKLIAVRNNLSSKKLILEDIKKSKGRSKELLARVQMELGELDKAAVQLEQLVQKEEEDLRGERPKVQEEKRHLMSVILHITKNIKFEVFSKWFTFEGSDPIKRSLMLEIFQHTLTSFEFIGSKRINVQYNSLFNKKKKQRHSLARSDSGWGVADWSDLDKIQVLLKAHKQETRSQSLDSRVTDEKSKKNMLSFFKQPKNVNMTAVMTLGLLGTNSGAPPPVPKSESSGLKLAIPTKDTPSAKIKEDTETHRRVYVEGKIMREKHMSADAAFFVLSVLIRIVDDIQKGNQIHIQHTEDKSDSLIHMNDDDDTENGSLLESKNFIEQLVRTITFFLHLNQPEKLLITLLAYLRVFIVNHPHILLSSSSDLGSVLCESFMALSNSTLESVRQQAASTLYVLTRTAFFASKGIHRPRIMVTVALSRTLQRTVPEEDTLHRSITSLGILAQVDPNFAEILAKEVGGPLSVATSPEDEKWNQVDEIVNGLENKVHQIDTERMGRFKDNVNELCQQLEKLLSDTISVNNTISGQDPNQTEDLLYRISEFYEGIPELRFVWLRQLAQYHKQQGQYEESAQCYYRILCTVFTQLAVTKNSLIDGLPLDYFYSLSPYLMKMKNDSKVKNTLLPQCSDFTEKGVINLLRTTISALELAEQYEHAIPLLKILIPLFERSDDFSNLSETHGSIRSMFEQINSSIQENSRIHSTYYRLYFYGEKWGIELANKQYIYKMPKLFKLFKMKARIAELFGADVELVTNPKKVDINTLDPNKRYLQFTNVKPVVDDDEDDLYDEGFEFGVDTIRKKKTKFEQNININKFYYETAFSKNSKKLSDKVTGIYKRKVILVVRDSFPDVKTRLVVVRELEKILTPIESAIENMVSQIQKLEEVLEPNPPDISQLQLVLQGSVRAGVNGGPKDIVESFMAKSERFKYRKEHVQILNDKCGYFLFLCEQALKVDSKYAKANERAMHIELEKGFIDTKNLFGEHLEPSTKVQRMIAEYHKHEEKKNATSFDPLKVENMEDIVQLNMNEYEMQSEDELDDLLRIPYNRNYKISNTQDEKKLTLADFLAHEKDDDAATPSDEHSGNFDN